MKTTEEAIEAITAATRPEDLFGAADLHTAKRRFHRLSLLVHPDRVDATQRPKATTAFARVADLYGQWQTHAHGNGIRFTGSAGSYEVGALHARGSVSNVYSVRGPLEAVVKVPRKPAANALLANERAALTDISALGQDHPWLAPYFPRMIDHLTHVDPKTGARRNITVLEALTTGFVPLSEVAAAHPDGIDPRDYAWMHRRLLRAVAGAHRAGWVHCAIVEENVLIHPELHGVVLAGWAFATRPGTPTTATVSAHNHAYPPEILAGQPVTSETDVYMTHGLMLRMLGDKAPGPMNTYAVGCMQESSQRRPVASDLLDEFDDLLDRLYGKRRFRPFAMPTQTLNTTAKGK